MARVHGNPILLFAEDSCSPLLLSPWGPKAQELMGWPSQEKRGPVFLPGSATNRGSGASSAT